MKLSGEEVRKIRETLRLAFPAATGKLEIVVEDADIGFKFAEHVGPYETRIQTLLEYAVGQYRLTKLLKAAVSAAPDNPELAEIAAFVRQYFVFLPQLLPSEDNTKELGDAERVLFKNIGFQNVRVWLDKVDRLTRVVCRIEPQPRSEGIGGYGTGFLVSPDVILTNDHVASGTDSQSGFWGRSDKAARVRVRFDCEYTADGNITNGKEYKLATDYQVLRSPVDQLDFALLKLDSSAGKPGDDMVLGKLRDFVIPVSHRFEESEPLLILQHPQAEPMKLAFGSLTPRSRWAPGHIAYSVNTDGGSSGSPCLTQDLAVAALHHWGSETHNRGVLMSAILAHWNKPEIRSRLIAAGLGHLVVEQESVPPPMPTPVTLASPTPNPPARTTPTPGGGPMESMDDLRELLAEQLWRDADVVTAQILQTAAGGSAKPLSVKEIQHIPGRTLRELDAAWKQASGGRFGFTAQVAVLDQIAQWADALENPEIWKWTWNRLGIRLEWRIVLQEKFKWVEHRTHLKYQKAVPVGHLPCWALAVTPDRESLCAFLSLCKELPQRGDAPPSEAGPGTIPTSEFGIDYTRLVNMLAVGNWWEANLESRRITKSVRVSKGGGTALSWADFPAGPLVTLDREWGYYSVRRFGLSTQLKLFAEFLAKAESSPHYDAAIPHNYDDWPIAPEPDPAPHRAVNLFGRAVDWLTATSHEWYWKMPGDHRPFYTRSNFGSGDESRGYYPILVDDVYREFPELMARFQQAVTQSPSVEAN
jgi:V8-like Glu-specific endopeptidase